jgi:hypothetical protein
MKKKPTVLNKFKNITGHWGLMAVILPTQEAETKKIEVEARLANVLNTLSQKHSTQKRAGRVAQVVECLPSKL